LAKIKIKSKAQTRVLIREDWKGMLDQIDYEGDEWDEWLEAPGTQEGEGQGRVTIVRAGIRRLPQY